MFGVSQPRRKRDFETGCEIRCWEYMGWCGTGNICVGDMGHSCFTRCLHITGGGRLAHTMELGLSILKAGFPSCYLLRKDRLCAVGVLILLYKVARTAPAAPLCS